jgi:hypothetical protein
MDRRQERGREEGVKVKDICKEIDKGYNNSHINNSHIKQKIEKKL